MPKKALVTFALLLMSASSILAQSNSSWVNLMNLTVNNSWTCEAIKRASDKSGKPLPEQCAYLNKSSSGRTGSSSLGSKTDQSGTAGRVTAKFTPVANAESFEQIAATISDVPEERQLLVQTAAVVRSSLEEQYGSKGWKNNVAGAVAYFAVSMLTVYYDKEPSEATQVAIFDSYNTAPEFASVSNKDKQNLYNAYLTYSGMPLLYYLKGKQDGDAKLVQQAKALAAHNLKAVLKADPEDLKVLMGTDGGETGKIEQPSAAGQLSSKYSCLRVASRNGMTVHEPAGLPSFTLSGGRYSVSAGTGGRVSVTDDTVEFSGGYFNGWRGETRTSETGRYILFRSKFTEIRRGETTKFGDVQCRPQ